jgi:hypothetical protein
LVRRDFTLIRDLSRLANASELDITDRQLACPRAEVEERGIAHLDGFCPVDRGQGEGRHRVGIHTVLSARLVARLATP